MRTVPILCSTLCLTALCAGQDLRRGLVDADAVIVGRQVQKRAHDDDLTLHRVQVVLDVRGAGGAPAVTVLDWPKLSLHNRPTPRQSRLYCLQDASAVATRLGLPAADGPYFQMVGWAGSNPLVQQDLDRDPMVRLARLLAASDAGRAPADTAAALADMALEPSPELRREATLHLAERPDLRSTLNGLWWNRLAARAVAEVDDIDYKVALAELCAAQRLDGLLDSLAVSLGPVTDPRYARCVGRIGKLLHGEQATERLLARLRTAGQDRDRQALLLAIGATRTESALEALLQMDKQDAAVQAALREHRSRRATEAAGTTDAADPTRK